MNPRRSPLHLPPTVLLLLGLAIPWPAWAAEIGREAPAPVAIADPPAAGSPAPTRQQTATEDEDGADESPARHVGRPRIAVVGSVGRAVELNGSVPVDPATLMVRYSRPLGERFLGGRPAWGVEAGVFRFDQEPGALGFGGHLLYEHRFGPPATVEPVLRLGAGALLTDDEVPPGETRHNFSLFAEAGLEARLGSGMWLQVGYRFHHLSNADTGLRNPGINAHAGVAGLAFAF